MSDQVEAAGADETDTAPKVRTARVDRKRAAQRDRILRAAIAEFGSRGYERTTMQDIADALDMTGAALYYYYKAKDELLFASLDNILTNLIEAIEKAVSDAGSEVVARLKALIAAHVRFELDDPTVGPLVNAHLYGPRYLVAALPAEQQARLRHHQRRIYERYRSLIDEGVDAGCFDAPDPVLATFDLLALAQYPVVWFRPDGHLSAEEICRRQADVAAKMLLREG
jgi:AcrR family transcriptional regulator